ncbi:MAG TPA: peptidoglycan bridge formation glycyltransferase FemA/FemB family protein [Anaerolineae bacterium]|nr:peptidoglycan bridge formation glycyltransferase FemA/FemB family protein [Anaerolineae bacterium]HQI86653.1 peptidoglycan bridge formation glycyltransferase FemA/FemB family protein [Anaerolineae bacterium]
MIELETWDAFVAAHPAGTILQTSRWAHLKATFGWDWEIVTTTDRTTNGGALVLYRALPLKLGTIAYVPRGPLVNWNDSQAVTATLDALRQAARRRRAWALWLEPEMLDTPEARAQLHACGLRAVTRTIQPPRTILVDIAPAEDVILARMRSKTRYNIRLAERKGVTVREGTVDDAAAFYALMTETGNRDEFGIHSEAYYRRVFELFLPTGHAALLLAEVEGELVAALVVFALGTKAWYLYGASSERHREKMPAYALQWTAIRWAKARGCTVYDLWGIPDFDEETLEAQFAERTEELWGVYRFKRGFGGQVIRCVGLWEQPLHLLYPLAARLRGYGAESG